MAPNLYLRLRHLQRATAPTRVVLGFGRRLTTSARIGQALRRRGRVRWRAELDDVASGHSLLELRYLRNVERRHGLPNGQRQAVRTRPGGRWYDDVRYEPFRTLVELDGQAAHPDGSRSRGRQREQASGIERVQN